MFIYFVHKFHSKTAGSEQRICYGESQSKANQGVTKLFQSKNKASGTNFLSWPREIVPTLIHPAYFLCVASFRRGFSALPSVIRYTGWNRYLDVAYSLSVRLIDTTRISRDKYQLIKQPNPYLLINISPSTRVAHHALTTSSFTATLPVLLSSPASTSHNLPSPSCSYKHCSVPTYMKYLYPYECEKRRLSTPGELQAAIDGNRREGRRGSYGTYAEMMQRSPSQMSPLSLVTAARPQVNGSAAHHPTNNNHLPHQALIPPALAGHGAAIPPAEFEARMVEYVKLLNKELRTSGATPPNHRQSSPPTSPPETALAAFDMSRLTLWNLYHNQTSPTEPQKEPINLEKREDPVGPPPLKRHQPDSEEPKVTGTHIKISSRNDGRGGGDNSLVVSMDINGTMYQGVLFAQTTRNSRLPS
ncbi:AT-rich interactive domain-containing protein 3A [Homalodisca vitripennis]|nr:AT-rich interactive domain-containing protein 3A [Homalodisca vitripennis]